MKYSEEDVRKALQVLEPKAAKYELEVLISTNILEDIEDKKYEYKINQIKKNGKKVWLASYKSRDIKKALDSLLKIYGYCRITRPQQSIEKQINSIQTEYPKSIIIQESCVGSDSLRPEWEKLLKELQPGDTVVFDSISRMSKTPEEGIETYFSLHEKGINLIFLKEHYIDTSVYVDIMSDQPKLLGPVGDLVNNTITTQMRRLTEKQIRIAFDQVGKEAKDLQQKTKVGIEAARQNGKQIGQKKGNKLTIKKETPAKEKILKFSRDFNGNLSDPECIELIGISRNTYYKYKKELRNSIFP